MNSWGTMGLCVCVHGCANVGVDLYQFSIVLFTQRALMQLHLGNQHSKTQILVLSIFSKKRETELLREMADSRAKGQKAQDNELKIYCGARREQSARTNVKRT